MMRRTGIAYLPLHSGKVPRWLFDLMRRLSREIVLAIVEEYGSEEFIRRISDPVWFQSLGCVLGFDWHSSGLTTTVSAALKEGISGIEKEVDLFVAGGKGATSRKTPEEIERFGDLLEKDPSSLIYASRMAAKVDTVALQDGYQLYHHVFIFNRKGMWAVIQQGMNERTRYARRYHWLGERVESFVVEPHSGILSEARGRALNLVARESERARNTIVGMVREEKFEKLVSDFKRVKELLMPSHHDIRHEDIKVENFRKGLYLLKEREPEDFESLISVKGIGPKMVRALALLSEVIHGAPPSFEDPARYSFAHGGKDGHPYPIDRHTYEKSIEILRRAIEKARIERSLKAKIQKRLI